MEQITLRQLQNYELIDSGDGMKLERFGEYILSRPDPNALWKKRLGETEWKKANALFGKNWTNKNVREPWLFSFDSLVMLLRLTPFKHTGIFPEQIENWIWLEEIIRSRPHVKILNLFGYTGGATLYAASHGAEVTHVDASKPALTWAHENQEASKLVRAPIRWIVDDARAFSEREARRGNTYDGIVLDPPSFGRSPKGKIFKFEKDMHPLLEAVGKLLSPDPLFVLLNSYATGYSPQTLKNLMSDHIDGNLVCGELNIRESRAGRLLPCSQFVRVTF